MEEFMKRKRVLPLIFITAVLVIFIAIKSRAPIGFEELSFPTKTVDVITAKKLPFRARVMAYGNVEPAVLLKSRTEISGKISFIHPNLKKGASLAKGTVVLRVEPTTFEFSRDQSKAGLTSIQSTLKQLEIEEASSKRALAIARKNLDISQKELDRFRILWDKRVITRSKLDAEDQKVLQLSQQVEELEGKLSAFSSRKSSTQAQIRKSENQLAQSQDTLGRTEIILPFDARIGKVSVEKGEFVSVGNILFEALGIQAVEINAQLPVSQFSSLIAGLGRESISLQKPEDLQLSVSRMQIGANVSLVGSNQNQAKWVGELLRIGESVDPTRNTVNVVVAVNNPYKNIIPGIKPPLLKGMYVAVELYAPLRDMLVLPRKALHQGRVYVATTDNKLQIRPVEILYTQGQLVVIKAGISGGEKIITTDVIPVIENLPVNPLLATDYEAFLAKESLGNYLVEHITGNDE